MGDIRPVFHPSLPPSLPPCKSSVSRTRSHTQPLWCPGRDGARVRGQRARARAVGHQGGMTTRAMVTRAMVTRAMVTRAMVTSLLAMPLPRRRNEGVQMSQHVCKERERGRIPGTPARGELCWLRDGRSIIRFDDMLETCWKHASQLAWGTGD